MDLGIVGRRALVTGGSQGIGAATARALAREGAHVLVVARRPEPLGALCAEIEQAGGRAEWVAADTATAAGRDAVAARAAGGIDILVNNVGGGSAKPLLELEREDWTAALEHNLLTAVDLTTRLLPGMIERGWGRAVHVGSIAAREPGHLLAPYAAAKAALVSYSKTLSEAVGRHGVLSTVVLPGLTDSASSRAEIDRLAERGLDRSAAIGRLMGNRRPAVGRIVAADEVAAAIAFLCGAPASAVTGASLAVDGGTLIGTW